MKKLSFKVEQLDKPQRIDRFLAVKLTGFTRAKVQQLCENHKVMVNGRLVGKSIIVNNGDNIEVNIAATKQTEILPENIPLTVYFADDYLAVIEKPKSLLLYPTIHQQEGTLANALKYMYGNNLSTLAGEERPGIVHRIDKDTSGLLIIAFNNSVHEKLNNMMMNKEISRSYIAVIEGFYSEPTGIIDASISRDRKNRTRMAVSQGGRQAKTEYKTIAYYNDYSLVRFNLITGRTHQIRVHSAYKGHPLAGDLVYGAKNAYQSLLNGQCLHAHKIAFKHPIIEKEIIIKSYIPNYFKKFISMVK